MIEPEYWPDYLTSGRESPNGTPPLDLAAYNDTLKVFECDLGKLAGAGNTIRSIEGLSLQSTTPLRIDDSFCFWQAPYPCHVERITFDTANFPRNGRSPHLFRTASFTIRSAAAPVQWVPAEKLEDLVVGSWLLPGHGVALLWKPSEP